MTGDWRAWLSATIAVVASYLIVSHGFFFFAGVTQIALFVGVIAGLVSLNSRQAYITSVVSLAVLQALSPPLLVFQDALRSSDWIVSLLLTGGSAYGIASMRAGVGDRRSRFDALLAGALVTWLLVNLWIPLVVVGIHPLVGYGPLSADAIRAVPAPGTYVNDDALFRRVFYLMHDGQDYYSAFANSWRGLQHADKLPSSVTAFRLPTMFWLWHFLPDDAFLVVVVFLVFASIGAVAAAYITGQLMGARFAPLASAAVAVYAMSIAISVYVMYVDFPSACIALVGVALLIRGARRGEEGDARWLWSAAAVLTIAALTREILAYWLVIGLCSTWVATKPSRRASRGPWLAALGVFALAYSAHVVTVVTRFPDRGARLGYLNGSPAYALKAISLFSDAFTGTHATLALLFALGVFGAWVTRSLVGWRMALAAVAVLLAPLIGMLRVGNPGIDPFGHQVNYWGQLFVPLALALWPVSLRALSAQNELPEPNGAQREMRLHGRSAVDVRKPRPMATTVEPLQR